MRASGLADFVVIFFDDRDHRSFVRITWCAYLLLVLLILSPLLAISQNTVTWIKMGNGVWNDPGNWETNTVPPLHRIPNAQDTVVIEHDSVSIPINYDAFARRIVLGIDKGTGIGLAVLDNATLTINDQLFTTEDRNTAIDIRSASLFNNGKISIHDCGIGILLDSNAVLDNLSHIEISWASNIWPVDGIYGIENFGHIANQSKIEITLAQWAILNRRNLINNDSICIETSFIGFYNLGGSFFNGINGKMSLHNNNVNLDASGHVTNQGEIYCSISGQRNIAVGGTLINRSSIYMDNGGQFEIRGSAVVTNEAGGTITIGDVCLNGIIFTGASATLANDAGAEIVIHPVFDTPFDTGASGNVFENFGLFEIQN